MLRCFVPEYGSMGREEICASLRLQPDGETAADMNTEIAYAGGRYVRLDAAFEADMPPEYGGKVLLNFECQMNRTPYPIYARAACYGAALLLSGLESSGYRSLRRAISFWFNVDAKAEVRNTVVQSPDTFITRGEARGICGYVRTIVVNLGPADLPAPTAALRFFSLLLARGLTKEEREKKISEEFDK